VEGRDTSWDQLAECITFCKIKNQIWCTWSLLWSCHVNSLPSDLHDISDTKWLKSVLFDCDDYYCLALLDISRSDSLHITFWTWTSGGLKSRCNGLSQITSQWPWKWCLCGLLSLPWTTECCEQLVSVLLCVLGCHRHSTPAGVCNAWRRHHREECYSEDMDGWF